MISIKLFYNIGVSPAFHRQYMSKIKGTEDYNTRLLLNVTELKVDYDIRLLQSLRLICYDSVSVHIVGLDSRFLCFTVSFSTFS